MDNYDKLVNSIKEKYSSMEIKQCENIISVYDLVVMLREAIEPYRKVKMNKELQSAINRDRTFFKRFDFLKRNPLINNRCTSYYTFVEKDSSVIHLNFGKQGDINSPYVEIIKDFNSDELYFGDYCLKDRDLVAKYIDEICYIFGVLEEYGTLFHLDKDNNRTCLEQEFNDGLLNVTVIIDTFGRVRFSIKPCNGVDSANIYDRKWINRETISKYVEGTSEDILKRIPVSLSDLDESYKYLVDKVLSKGMQSTLSFKK